MQLMAINSWRDVIVVVEGAIIFAMTQHGSGCQTMSDTGEKNGTNRIINLTVTTSVIR